MQDRLVSIIIPAYNTAEWVRPMIPCVLNQTYKNLEIIIVNDGSTDDTLSIIKEITIRDKRVKIIDIPNGGVSNARNVALEICTGEKIFFWDSDDIVELSTVEDCLNYADKIGVRSVIYGYSNRLNGINGEPCISSLLSKQKICTKDLLIPMYIGNSFTDINEWIEGKHNLKAGKMNSSTWHAMYDAETIRNNQLKFDINLSVGEDTIFNCFYFMYEDSIGYLPKCLYYLTMRESGANLSGLKNPIKRMSDKSKLYNARKGLDNIALQVYNWNTYVFWEGTIVLGAIEMAFRLNGATTLSFIQKFKAYKEFISDSDTKKAFRDFHPVAGIKTIPFYFYKFGFGMLFFCLCSLIPMKIVQKQIW